jgi:hypothetical protein
MFQGFHESRTPGSAWVKKRLDTAEPALLVRTLRVEGFWIRGEQAVGHEKNMPQVGIVASRTCPLCGQNVIGFTTGDGEFHALKPGTLIRFLEGPDLSTVDERPKGPEPHGVQGQDQEEQASYRVWVPAPVRAYRPLRLKYGVLLKEELMAEEIPSPLYQTAYVDKLRRLIEKEIYVPVPVILDRFFTAPYLASGDPKQIAEAMWHELKEIRGPALAVVSWLDEGDPKALLSFTTAGASGGAPAPEGVPEQQSLILEQEALSLEEFLQLL